MPNGPRPRQSGLTLVESAAVLGVVSVLLGSGLPELHQLRATQQLNSAAALLRTDLQYARSSAVSLDQTLRFHVQSSAAGSCYVIHTGSPSACTCTPEGGANCTGTSWTLRSVQLPASQRIGITSNSTSMAFSGTQGTVTPTGTLTVRNDQGAQLKVVVNVMGRTRTCQAAGSPAGHPAC